MGWHPAHIPASLPVPQFTAGEDSAAAAALDVTKISPVTLATAATQADPVFRSECDPIKPLPTALSVPSLRSDNPEPQGWHSPSRHPFTTDKETETERKCTGQGQRGCRWGPTVIKHTISCCLQTLAWRAPGLEGVAQWQSLQPALPRKDPMWLFPIWCLKYL